MPWVRIISSGAQVSQRLRDEGFDACFVPKGYDQTLLSYQRRERDIELAFIGSTKSVAYSGRKALLDELGRHENLLVTKTKSGEEYADILNRIRFFVSADVGMGEYMIKNFEAMACGCVLLAYDHGELENSALGFVDMENLVLYRGIDDLRKKLDVLRRDPAQATAIAEAGQRLVVQRYGFASIGQQIVESMRHPLRQVQEPNWLQRQLRKFGIY
jgi:glycosyltransferase involved in cell wall biosynthesis